MKAMLRMSYFVGTIVQHSIRIITDCIESIMNLSSIKQNVGHAQNVILCGYNSAA